MKAHSAAQRSPPLLNVKHPQGHRDVDRVGTGPGIEQIAASLDELADLVRQKAKAAASASRASVIRSPIAAWHRTNGNGRKPVSSRGSTICATRPACGHCDGPKICALCRSCLAIPRSRRRRHSTRAALVDDLRGAMEETTPRTIAIGAPE
jgi:hypothetical protein